MPDTTDKPPSTRLKKWLWFVGIYLVSLLAFSAAVYTLRWLIVP